MDEIKNYHYQISNSYLEFNITVRQADDDNFNVVNEYISQCYRPGFDYFCKLSEQQKNQQPLKNKNRFLKQPHDTKVAESLLAITKKLDVINEATKELGEIVKKLDVEEGTPKHQLYKVKQARHHYVIHWRS